jgi:hypothetical protein
MSFIIDKKDAVVFAAALCMTHFYCYAEGDHRGWSRGYEYGVETTKRYHNVKSEDVQKYYVKAVAKTSDIQEN